MSAVSSSSLNMNVSIMLGVSKLIASCVREAVEYCASERNFDAEEMLNNMNLIDLVKKSKTVKSKTVKEKVVKEKTVKEKCLFPIPYDGSLKEGCCLALRQNHGLYTQCETVVSDSDFCKKCGPTATYGTIKQRLEVGFMEYRDPKGKSPTPFEKIMKKLKISRSDVELEAGRLNIVINDIHFIQEERSDKKEKGRPKKPRRKIELVEDNSTDLFAELVARANENSEEEEEEISDLSSDDLSSDEKSSIAESIIDSVLDKVSVISENNEKKAVKLAEKQAEKAEKESAKLVEKEAAKQALIQKKEVELVEKEAAKQALIQKKEAELVEKEAAKQALILKKEAELVEKEAAKQALILKKEAELVEKEAAKQALILKKEAELAEKEAAKQALILKKEAELVEKEAAKQALIQKKEAAKQAQIQKKTVEKPAAKAKKDSSDSETEKTVKPTKKAAKVEEEEEQDVVKRFEFEGVKYLKSKNTGIIYNLDQDVIGKWNEKTNKIDFEKMDSEEEEDEYEE